MILGSNFGRRLHWLAKEVVKNHLATGNEITENLEP